MNRSADQFKIRYSQKLKNKKSIELIFLCYFYYFCQLIYIFILDIYTQITFKQSKLDPLTLHMHSFQLCLRLCAHICKNYLVLFVEIRKFPCQTRQMFLELVAQLSHWISNQYQIYCPGDASPQSLKVLLFMLMNWYQTDQDPH